MRRHKGLLTAIVAVALLLLIAALAGRSRGGDADRDLRASTYVTGPSGASALYEALRALRLETVRRRVRGDSLALPGKREATLLLDPVRDPLPNEVKTLLAYNAAAAGGELVIAAGPRWDAMLRCFGYSRRSLSLDSTSVLFGSTVPRRPFFTHAVLEPGVGLPRSSSPFRVDEGGCPIGALSRVDTLVMSPRGPLVLAVRRTGSAHDAILVADIALFRNRSVRRSDAGVYLLSLLSQRYDRVVFDEYHQGYGSSGSLARALAEWSLRSPIGWGVWQAAIVGVLALLASAVRFGKPRELGERARRSSREHVRALATALAAAHGHDVAVEVLVRGLRRRLGREQGGVIRNPAAGSSRSVNAESGSAQREWLADIARRPLAPKVREAVTTLQRLTTPGQDEAAVLAAANAVEDAWDALRHSSPTSWRR